MSDSEDEPVTINEYIESLEEHNLLVLGGINCKETCTFTQGYVKRQALYTCATCLNLSETKAAFCYPCSIHCHSGHDIVELYTKRYFRCDCGNAKFSTDCTLWEEKDDENEKNKYDQTFSNTFCSCHRPYPDESYEGVEEMFQCVLCEDWFHIEHLNIPHGGSDRPVQENSELTCHYCLIKYPFLSLYVLNNREQPCYTSLISRAAIENVEHLSVVDCSMEIGDQPEGAVCLLEKIAQNYGLKEGNFSMFSLEQLGITDISEVTAVFWSIDWRFRLCRCSQCEHLYKYFHIEFLLDPEDTMDYYTSLSKTKEAEIEKGNETAISETLKELPHSAQVTFLQGMNQFSVALQGFLTQQRDADHVVTEAEVRAFFDSLKHEDWWPH